MHFAAQSGTAPPQPGSAPFRLTPDLKFIFMTAGHAAAAAALRRAIAAGKHVIVMTGEPGTGKTMLLTQLRREAHGSTEIAYCPYPALSLAPMLQAFLGGPDAEAENDLDADAIATRLAARHAGRHLVLIVDDATRSPLRLLVDLCRVAELLSKTECTLQIVLAANAAFLQELNRSMAEAGMSPGVEIEVPPMTSAEIGAYVAHRLAVAALPADLFTGEAVAEVARHAGGIARAINQICSRALMLSEWRQERPISAALIVEAIEDCPIDALVVAHFAREASSAAESGPLESAGARTPSPPQQENDGAEALSDLPSDGPTRSGDPAEEPGAALEVPAPPSAAKASQKTVSSPTPAVANHSPPVFVTPGASWRLREMLRQRRLARGDRLSPGNNQAAPRYAGFTARHTPRADLRLNRVPTLPGAPRKAMRWPMALTAAALAAGVLVYQRPEDFRPVVGAISMARHALESALEDPSGTVDRLFRGFRATFRSSKQAPD